MSTRPSRGYAHPELLADTAWLAQHLTDPKVRIVNMGPYDGYFRAHIPGSVHPGPADKSHYLKDSANPLHVMPPEAFAELMARFGIGDDTTVVAYDAEGGHTAARLWFVMGYYGNANCKVLNGGWNKWLAEGRPGSMAVPTYPRARFTIKTAPGALCKMDEVKGYVNNPGVTLLDVRTDSEWDGTNNSRGNRRLGHIPGAVHLEWRNFVTADALMTFKPAAELHLLLARHGVTRDKLVVTY